ncbi:lysophospholipase [Candidatus Nitromaritima sp. SCGC AAA799-C22]|nr:lysophospholipase [Candidatus Nitromaritima sp. SCGC AAA799-C22]
MNILYVVRARKTFKSGRVFLLWIALFLFGSVQAIGAGGPPPVILAFGDSLTAGFGVPEDESYPAQLQETLSQNGYPHRVVNGGVSGDTTAGGLRRIEWLMKHNPRIVILGLGANDGLRGLSLKEMESNLERIITVCREGGARVLLAGMKITPNLGEDYADGFEKVYSRLAKKYELSLIPFLLEGVAAKREYVQSDGLHPLGPGYTIVTETVWKHLKPLLDNEKR